MTPPPPGSLAHALARAALGAPLAGTTLGAFVIEGELGRGAVGIVLRARDRRSGAAVALKVLIAGAEASVVERRRFLREAELARAVAHPAVVPVLDAGDEHGLLFIAFALVEGTTLAKAFAARPEPAQVLSWMAAVAQGVAAGHARGIVHRDLKPSNVLVRTQDGQPLVTDFGLARDMSSGSSLTRTGGVVGTPAYMAPEQAKGKPVTPASDVFALGEMLYEGLTGKVPFIAPGPAQRYAQIMAKAPAPPSSVRPGLPAGVDAVVLRCLRPKPEERFADARALADALAPFVPASATTMPTTAEASPASASAPPAARGATAALLLVGAAALLLVLAIGYRLSLRAGDPAPVASSVAVDPARPSPFASPAAPPCPAPVEDAQAARDAIRDATLPDERRRLVRAFLRAHPDHRDADLLRGELRGWRRAELDPAAPGPGGRDGMERAVAWDPVRRRVLVYAGWDGSRVFDDLWAWDGLTWTLLEPDGPRPPGRFAHVAAWDVTRERLVVFGGRNASSPSLADTWTWDGRRWEERSPLGVPGGRCWQALAWDEEREVLVLFGAELWTWDGELWTPGAAARGPVAREACGMAWDRPRRRMLVFGGFGGGRRLGDLWALQGETWTQLTPPGPTPPGRQAPCVVHDGARLLVFGGHGGDGSRLLGDTWEYDGERWRELELSPAPSPRTWSGMAHDEARRVSVLFGGGLPGSQGRTAEVWELE